ncbi:MAG: hypothetical protein CMJ21_00055 [Phycisphaerae bacterium]|jgi:hypothetical protein|nr:hypothetical protein [Phycisphaerae bacterium]MDP6154296.1 lipopolysaccharide kinase InaA family protein [Phycisphaeraceae bacterium]MDP7346654.1 lipopolysaccharide kinase InaA family protein [Phycisphaeraceae bacterium]
MGSSTSTSHVSDGPSLVAAPRDKTYKIDARSQVWRVRNDDGAFVIKRFEFSPIKQLIYACVGAHPAQWEQRWSRILREHGIDVLPIASHGSQRVGVGIKRWLATREQGMSLWNWIDDGQHLCDRANRVAVTRRVANITAGLIHAGFFNRDLKTANFLVDPATGRVALIDVGATRRSRRRENAMRMLAKLNATARHNGASRTDRLRCLLAIINQCALIGDWKTIAREIDMTD